MGVHCRVSPESRFTSLSGRSESGDKSPQSKTLLALGLACLTAACATWLVPAAVAAPAPEASGVRISTQPAHAVVPPGGNVEVRVKVLDDDGPATGKLTTQAGGADAGNITSNLNLDDSGEVAFPFHAPAEAEPGIHTISLRHAPSGAARTFYVDVVDRATYDRFVKVVNLIELEPGPAHVLFIGDSLTDMYRGRNYVDKVGFFLEKRYGDRVTVKNVGVGGDYILRVWARLSSDPDAYRLSMYDGIFEPVPTHVFFFLGHNDCKLTSRSGYASPLVSPAEFDQKYRAAIRKVGDATGAKIAVISATSSVYEITEATAAKRRAAGKPHNLFGKPEALERFNAIAKKVARECGADYLDVYGPTREHPDKPSLFTRDGVHVNNLGNRLVAFEVLMHLAVTGPAPRVPRSAVPATPGADP